MIVFSAPFTSKSGYGERARSLAKSLLEIEDNVYFHNRSWGNTRETNVDFPVHQDLKDKFDHYIQLSLASEFVAHGHKTNIGITAGTEVDRISIQDLIASNKMDLVLVSSDFSKRVFETTEIEDAVGNTYKVETPVEVLNESVDDSTFKNISIPKNDTFTFLSVGEWDFKRPHFGRKGLTELVYTFYKTFADTGENVRMCLKTGNSIASTIELGEQVEHIKDIKHSLGFDEYPEIKIIYDTISKEEMVRLYNRSHCYVSMTKGEGFGRTMLESMFCGTPVVAPGITGQLDYLNTDNALLTGAFKAEVPEPVCKMHSYPKGSKWYHPNPQDMGLSMLMMYNKYEENSKLVNNLEQKEYKISTQTKKINQLIKKYK